MLYNIIIRILFVVFFSWKFVVDTLDVISENAYVILIILYLIDLIQVHNVLGKWLPNKKGCNFHVKNFVSFTCIARTKQ